jgi:phosphoenolpyruvate carboxykinase (ATP)
MVVDGNFGLLVPQGCPDVPEEVLTPRNTWGDKAAYDTAARDLVGRFQSNFEQYEAHVDAQVRAAAPEAA